MKLIFAVADIVYSWCTSIWSFSQNTGEKYLIRMQLKNCEATLPVFVLILMLDWLKWMGNGITFIYWLITRQNWRYLIWLTAFKFQLRPNGQQEREMRRFAGACRFVFNRALARQNENYKAGNKYIPYTKMASWLIEWKSDTETRLLR